MTTRRRIAVAALTFAVTIAVVLTLLLSSGREPSGGPGGTAVTSPGGGGSPDRPTAPATPPTSTPPRPARPAGPPEGTVHVAERYLRSYRAVHVGWDEVLARGRPLPPVSSRCADRWRKSGKDPRVDWPSGDFLCLDALQGRGYKPQGLAGSATTTRYPVGSRPAAQRNILLVSAYSRQQLPGLFAPNHAGESVTRLVVIDQDQRRYNTVELVKPDGPSRLRNLNSHGSGLAWAGQYLYSSSHSTLWMYNADDLMEISGRFVLPAVARWKVQGPGGLSSISLDASARPRQLVGINYSTKGQAYVHSFDLASDGLLRRGARGKGQGAGRAMFLENQFGADRLGPLVHSARSQPISGTNYQGVGTRGRYTFANSSGMRTKRSGSARVDATAVLKDGKVIDTIEMPEGNGESVFLDYRRGTYHSMVEHGGQFLFSVPIRELVSTAEN